jgi:hypothetical protein
MSLEMLSLECFGLNGKASKNFKIIIMQFSGSFLFTDFGCVKFANMTFTFCTVAMFIITNICSSCRIPSSVYDRSSY